MNLGHLMSASHLLAFALIAGGAVLYFGLYGLCLLATRPARPTPAPATQDLGPNPEPPAIVSMLVAGWDITEDAAESTLLDLGARKLLEFRQPADDPMQTTIHVRVTNPNGLNAYEQRVFDRINAIAVGGVVPLTALTFRDPAQATGFRKRITAEVIADARARGLSRRRFSPAIVAALTVTAVAAAIAATAAAALLTNWHKSDSGDAGKGVLAVGFFTFVALAAIGGRNVGERDTPAGREVAARWLGVKTWLRNTEAFADLPPSAVATWDRYLAYGAAVGATRVSSAVIDMGMGNRKRVWSSFGGTWHRVRVRYPRFYWRYGKPAPPVIIRGLIAGAISLLLLKFWAHAISMAEDQSVVRSNPLHNLADPIRLLGLTVALVLGVYAAYMVLRMIIDLATPVTITGQVLWMQTWKSTSAGENSPARPTLYYLAIDDGSSDQTRAWGLPPVLAGPCADGDTVTITVRRWTRRVGKVEVVERGTLRRADASQVTTDRTENLVLSAMGIPTARTPSGGTTIPAAQLLTAEEVSRAFSVSTQSHGSAVAAVGQATNYVGPDGKPVLTVIVAEGFVGSMALRSRRHSTPVPGIGEEAYTGDGWACARRGDTVIMLQIHGSGRNAPPGNTFWLLQTAVGRLTAPATTV